MEKTRNQCGTFSPVSRAFFSPLILLTIVALGGALNAPSVQSAPQTAIADDGREVLLKENGEWEYITDDVFATTPDGQRIRLQSDQRWIEIRDAEAPALQIINTLERDTASIADHTLVLDQVHIENQRESIGKNTRLRSNIVLYLEVEGNADDYRLSRDQFSVTDSKGNDYPVFSVVPGTEPISREPRWVIRAKGAPRWWGVKYFSLRVAPNALGNPASIELRKPMRDVIKREVSDLPEDDF